ncbi:MAG: hypothetical protein NC393_09875 [Clostridium sp.]|nr:hypothetical protein [Clostridium sp.]MCM1172421.1 hypothetical protein [Clostridium sp.]MCM1209777.1 hypothetical protein [Ruminococcus sp.]
MKKAIKKAGLLVSMVGLMSMTLVGCAKKTECEACGETKKCYEYEMSLEGETETAWYCDDCAEEMESLITSFGGTFKKK